MPPQDAPDESNAEGYVCFEQTAKPNRAALPASQMSETTTDYVKRTRRRDLVSKTIFCLIISLSFVASAQSGFAQSKENLTPTFWQRDPEADFEDEGRMHCAPTSVSDGLIYLSKAFGMKNLVPGTGHKAQIQLIQELAEEFGTDPSSGGTNPDKILAGLQSYVKSKGYELDRLEMKSWRGVSRSNRQFVLGKKPDMAWMRSAARAKDTVVIFNFGWYYEGEDGYTRKGGHWIAVVDSDGSNEFTVHNPILSPAKQAEQTSLKLTLLDDDFIVSKDSGEVNMKGFYKGDGSGLPHGKSVTAILDAVIAFSLKRD